MRLNGKGAALGVAVGLAAGGAGGALATSGDSGPKPAPAPKHARAAAPQLQALVNAFLADVAKRLGTDVAKLTDALEGAAIDQVEQAVTDGKLTRAQADAIEQRIRSVASGKGLSLPGLGLGLLLPPPGRMQHGPPAPLARGASDLLAAAASYLGTTPAELRAELRSGKSLSEIAQAHGKTVAGLEQAIAADVAKKLDAFVQGKRG